MCEKHEPSDLEILSGVISGQGSISYTGKVRQRNVRIHGLLDAQLCALTRTTSLSYQQLLNAVIDVGLQALQSEMGDAEFYRFAAVDNSDLHGFEVQAGEAA